MKYKTFRSDYYEIDTKINKFLSDNNIKIISTQVVANTTRVHPSSGASHNIVEMIVCIFYEEIETKND